MKRLPAIILMVGVIVLAVAASSYAASRRGFSGGRPGPSGHPGGHFVHHPRFEGHRHFRHDRVFVAPFFAAPFVVAPAFLYAPPPVYWYYCPSYGAYYPYVPSCPEPWVPIPAS